MTGLHDERGLLVVGLVHTVPGLAETFERMLTEAEPRIRATHVADAWLLQTAVETGVDDVVRARVAQHSAHLAAAGASAVLVTCSSIGETVAGASEQAGIPVIRVDASMAQQAASAAARAGERCHRPGRVAVLATLESTLGPTVRLVEHAVAITGASVSVVAEVVDHAAAARAAGNQQTHDHLVGEAVHLAAGTTDVVVLAQASMAAALDPATAQVDVLTSPVGGVRDLIQAARSAGAEFPPGRRW